MNHLPALPEFTNLSRSGSIYECSDGELIAQYQRAGTVLLVGSYGLQLLEAEQQHLLQPTAQSMLAAFDVVEQSHRSADGFIELAAVQKADGEVTRFSYDERYGLLLSRSSRLTSLLGRFAARPTPTTRSLALAYSKSGSAALLSHVDSVAEVHAAAAESFLEPPTSLRDRRRIASSLQPLSVSRRTTARLRSQQS